MARAMDDVAKKPRNDAARHRPCKPCPDELRVNAMRRQAARSLSESHHDVQGRRTPSRARSMQPVDAMPSMAQYVAHLAAEGRYHFTTEEAVEALGQSVARVRAALRRLKVEGQIVDPHRSFHVILPSEHRDGGCPPAEDFVPPLMQYLEEPYYVALLSAAEVYGVTQEQHAFQVMAPQNHPRIDCGESRVRFSRRKDLARTPVLDKPTARGPIHIASPEATALELVGYADRCGGLVHVAGVVSDLAKVIEPQRLASAALLSPIAWAQRLGYLLDMTDNRTVANALTPLVKELAHDFAPLVRARPKGGAARLPRWKLAVNTRI